MRPLTELWATLTAPQATIISGIFTLLAAIFGVLIGWWLFSGRVKDLKGAIDASDRLLAGYRSGLEEALIEIKDKVAGLDAQLTSAMESLSTLRGSVGDLQSKDPLIDEIAGVGQAGISEGLRDNWYAIRDQLEQHAADPKVDGRTRAKYARIDRRRYLDLIDALASDGALGADTQCYREAAAIWQKYRNGRRSPSPDDSARMFNLRGLLSLKP